MKKAKHETIVSPEVAFGMLKISAETMDEWVRDRFLEPVNSEGLFGYRLSDVKKILRDLKDTTAIFRGGHA